MPLASPPPASERFSEVTGMCRLCSGSCVMRFTLDQTGRIVAARGDQAHPLTRGYACIKGLTLHEAHYSPKRILHPLKRMPDGRFVQLPLSEALDEIADRISALIGQYGPDALGVYRGTFGYDNALMPALMSALGSRSFFSTVTIDQSAKFITADRLGHWEAGRERFDEADVLLLSGTNPLVSLTTFNLPPQNPQYQLAAARKRGLKLIVIDPRQTETAKAADIHLQPRPGEDAVLFAGLVRIVLEQNWIDRDFCGRHVTDLAALTTAVAPFSPEMVAARAGVPPQLLMQAARAFAEPFPDRRKRGGALSGTGTDMGPHSNLAEHLLECLNVLCGRFARAGDRIGNPGVFVTPRSYRAQVVPPKRSWETGWKSMATGHGMLAGEKMAGAMADEILTPSPDQVRALIVEAGNPANAVPGQARIVEALKSLDLLVTIDPFMTNTGRLAHFILPSPMMLEKTHVGNRFFESMFLTWPMSTYGTPVISPPEGSELIDCWEVSVELARRLGVPLEIDGEALDLTQVVSISQINERLFRASRVPFTEIANQPSGHVFELESEHVLPADADDGARFDIAPADVVAELAGLAAPVAYPPEYTHRLAVRRMREVTNTMNHFPAAGRRQAYNPAYLHPDDLHALGLAEGDRVHLASPHGQVGARVAADRGLRRGVVSLAHGWGGLPDDPDFGEEGTNSNRLTSAQIGRDPINAMPVMTGIPLKIFPIPDA